MDIKQYKLNKEDAFLLTIDIQERLLPAMERSAHCKARAVRLLRGAELFGIPGCATEQYPKGLGPTVPAVKEALEANNHPIFAKTRFTALIDEVAAAIEQSGRKSIIVTGIEAHVCVFQTVRDLLAKGYRVYVPVDAVDSRFSEDKAAAVRLYTAMGAVVTASETILFDLLGDSKSPEFKAVSNLVKAD